MLKGRQKELGQSSVLFVDIAAETYVPEDWLGIDTITAAGIEGKGIHGILPGGEIISGIPVFRLAYEELGWGWLFAAYDVPGLHQLIEAGYFIFAVNRLRLTGRGQDDAAIRELLARIRAEAATSQNGALPP